MIGAADEHAHAVAPQAFQTWKENWCLCAVDPAQRFAAVFHVSLRPVTGEGVFRPSSMRAGTSSSTCGGIRSGRTRGR